MKANGTLHRVPVRVTRAAIYCRKSTEHGLEQEFNSLDAQREAGEAFIASQRLDGWQCLPEQYHDGGFTGANTDRPALRRLLADIEAGKIDAVVVYKVDRLSRSLLDFAKLMELFDQHSVAFVSVTQAFNTGSSTGRLVMNVLLSFAEFERAIISERTRDKIAAARRKGKWSGGLSPLGYDVDPATRKLIVNADEAARVRCIFNLYHEHGSMLPVVEELRERSWLNKKSTKKKGSERGGRPFDRTSLHRLLTSVVYIGRVPHKGEPFAGEHAAIVDPDLFAEVQQNLRRNGRTGGTIVRNRYGSLLKGILRCTACDCAMSPSFTSKGGKRYRYYVCSAALKRGRKTCPAKSIPADTVEQFVVDRLRCVGRDPALVAATVAEVRKQAQARVEELAAERRTVERDIRHAAAEVQKLTTRLAHDRDGFALQRLADLQQQIGSAESELVAIGDQEHSAKLELLDPDQVAGALSHFDGVWEALTPKEQAKIVASLVANVDYDGRAGSVTIDFHAAGIHALADQVNQGSAA